MTKNEFISFLESHLDFLDSVKEKIVLSFFQEKFSFCATLEEENAMIEAFGTPEQFIENLKMHIFSANQSQPELYAYLESILQEKLPSLRDNSSEGDVIFSRPIPIEKASKVIHSMDDREVKTLYGEKVVIENRTESIEETVSEPIDEANGLTTEEIRIAKKKTLEKTEGFSSKTDETRIPLEEEDFVSEENVTEETGDEKKEFIGLFHDILPDNKYNKTTKLSLLALLTLAVSPLLLFAFGLVILLYAALVTFTLIVVVTLFALMVVLLAIGIIELVHGFLVLFDSVAAALIELGFGTILFSLVIAIAALIYEFIFAIVPKWLKWVTKTFIHYTKLIYCYLYGGKA